jgi:hypothetical protein
VLRWQVLFHKALTPFLVSAYAVVAGVIGMACGYFAESLASHIRPSGAKTAVVQERRASRVEIWLKAQAVVFEKPAITQADKEVPVADLPAAALQRPVRHAAEMAAALDGSEAVSVPSTLSIVASDEGPKPADSVEPVNSLVFAEIREPAESTTVSLALAESMPPVESPLPIDSARIVEGLNSVDTQSAALPGVTIRATQLKRTVKMRAAKRPGGVPAKSVKSPAANAGEKIKLASGKLRKMPKPVALAKTITPAKLGTAVIRARFADTPSEIIRRSLMGTG